MTFFIFGSKPASMYTALTRPSCFDFIVRLSRILCHVLILRHEPISELLLGGENPGFLSQPPSPSTWLSYILPFYCISGFCLICCKLVQPNSMFAMILIFIWSLLKKFKYNVVFLTFSSKILLISHSKVTSEIRFFKTFANKTKHVTAHNDILSRNLSI